MNVPEIAIIYIEHKGKHALVLEVEPGRHRILAYFISEEAANIYRDTKNGTA